MLSFISRQVGERYQEALIDLVQRTGWRLSINFAGDFSAYHRAPRPRG
jgi:hypothetical protein